LAPDADVDPYMQVFAEYNTVRVSYIIEKTSVYHTVNGDLHCFTHRKQQK